MALTQIQEEMMGGGIGRVSFFAMSSAPNGWIKANGAAISRTAYAALFAALGTTYGSGDGSTTFNVPDMRGEFPRGFDDGRGVDSGRTIGSAQSGQNASHTHGATTSTASLTGQLFQQGNRAGMSSSNGVFSSVGDTGYAAVGSSSGVPAYYNFNASHSHTLTTDASGGTETRPRNVALLACIKY